MKKNINKRLLIVVLLLVISVISGTFAWFTYRSKESALVLSIADLKDTKVIIKPYQIREKMIPVATYTSGVYSQVKVTNSASNKMYFTLYYRINQLSETLATNGLKYTIASSTEENGTYTEVVTGDFTTAVDEEEVIALDTKIDASSTLYYRVYLWVDSSIGEQSVIQNEILDIELNASIDHVPNAPVLDEGMIPVTIADDGTVTTISSDDESWYDYRKQEWANIVLVTDSSRSNYLNTSDVTVSSSDILAYYVWIPRYRYKIWTTGVSSSGSEQTINILFETTDLEMATGTSVGQYRTHPAFWWDNDGDGVVDSGETLPGIWIGKFETTGSDTTPTVLPNETSLRSQNVSSQFQTSLLFSGGTLSNGNVTFAGSSTYGLTSNTDSHMAKNSEWGAIAYLSHSKYGIDDEIRVNNNSDYTTGCGASDDDDHLASECQIAYGEVSKYPQSNTGNISGIFDLSGGAWEYVMGVLSDSDGNPRSGYASSLNSGFNGSSSGSTYTSGIAFPESKYYNLYLQSQFTGSQTTNHTFCTLDTCGGHALNETAGWHSYYGYFVDSTYPWFRRGGGTGDGSGADVFESYPDGGNGNAAYSWRSVLIP